MINLPPQPSRIAALPKDRRGYPVPWFIEWVKDGRQSRPTEPGAEPDFRAMSESKRRSALSASRCWICGTPLGAHRVFVVGPMCVINRVSSEPPSHRDCAEFAAKACPFIIRPRMKRLPQDNIPGEVRGPGGIMLERNPGASALYEVKHSDYHSFRAGTGWLIKMGPPERIDWWAEGRAATRAEIEESIESGYPFLHKLAVEEGPRAVAELEAMRATALQLIPAA